MVPYENQYSIFARSLVEKIETNTTSERGWEAILLGFVGDISRGSQFFDVMDWHVVRRALAKYLRRVYVRFYAGKNLAREFGKRVRVILRHLQLDSSVNVSFQRVEGKVIPSFHEAVNATLRRYAFIESFIAHGHPATQAFIVGGSMSYGAFYCVREKPDSNGGGLLRMLMPL